MVVVIMIETKEMCAKDLQLNGLTKKVLLKGATKL